VTRLFVALDLPEAVRVRLEGLQGGVQGARWQTAEQMHLTLRFIGEVDGISFREICDALGRIEAEAFDLTLEGVGHFPPRGQARVLWAGVGPSDALVRLRERVEATIVNQGFEPEGRNFAPHVTLARFKSRTPVRRLQEFLLHHALFSAGPFPIGSFQLFSSHLGSTGAHYVVEASYPLVGAEETDSPDAHWAAD
jgi:2'-5' RNA ligase